MTNTKINTKYLKTQKIIKTLTFFSVLVFVFSIGLKIYFTSLMAVKNTQLRELFDQKSLLEREISDLSFIDCSLSSIESVEKKAYQLGFVPMKTGLLSLELAGENKVAVLSTR